MITRWYHIYLHVLSVKWCTLLYLSIYVWINIVTHLLTFEQVSLQTQLEYKFPDIADDKLGHKFHFCHRLDFATSGLLCVAKHKAAAKRMSSALADRRVTKVYVALLAHTLLQDLQGINETIGIHFHNSNYIYLLNEYLSQFRRVWS